MVFARGTTEPVGVGFTGQMFVDALEARLPGRAVDVYPVNYPASLDFQRAADQVEEWAQADPDWLPTDADGTRHPAAEYRYDKVPIPFGDLPFGVAWRLGYRSTTSNRKDSQQGIQIFFPDLKY